MGSGKQRWKISFRWSIKKQQPPKEFICSISGSLMADPVIVSSGQTFDRNCVQACKSLGFNPILLSDGSIPDFSTVIPNLALKSTILNWCDAFLIQHPKPIDVQSAEKLVRTLIMANSTNQQKSQDSELNHSSFSNSEEPMTPPLPLTTRPACYSSSPSSSEIEIETPPNPNSLEEDDQLIISKLRSSRVFEQEEAVISLRKITRIREEIRFDLCSQSLLSTLRSLIVSRYATIQVNAIAALLNLSLEDKNKVKIVRSGIVPPLIDVLRGGFPEAQDHAAGALFSLALDDHNKTAIGVLGALPPLLHALQSVSERTRNDSALALYHLSLVQSNRSKLVKLGSVQALLGMVKSGHLTGRIMLVLSNLASCVEGRDAMLDGGAVECFVGMLRGDELDAESTRDSCLVALYGLSCGGLRFKGLAKEAGAEEVLRKVENVGSRRARGNARMILESMKKRDEEEEVDWEELLNSGEVSRSRYQLVYGSKESGPISTHFPS